jgi:predicted nuclease of predicted toxin-antitoxin system
MDECVRGQIISGLLRRGIDVQTAVRDGFSKADDDVILDRATQLQRLVYTEDDDFLAEANSRQTGGIHFVGVVYANKNSVTIRQAIEDLELIASVCDLEEMQSLVHWLPLRPRELHAP